ncbi:GNAT family N-acetyltransferase [Enterococcus faecalis]|uniref:GNAT family N-acetyltransferase n=1 Tax=Enterococcus faecalis TaxID=1351 RepID=UPI000CF6A796|nr:GNAT family N-acetyltransferase [Enterococcus faecalis]EGO5110021.1 GNAT family N-acetyltransferase [Enterococcus faecalis]EGO8762835.1 GNAT family N-acetyltransferase [Enterococcus faecalis]EGO8911402.1 GNAT family N-acetyltransferase [Enterococcus faecalis]EKI2462940.1 GNAT family N-acetyltransferase [Enterococcus faecalis]EKZ0405257.1 GNAT family N-acetyltransferase [Enterococcus faecalis]
MLTKEIIENFGFPESLKEMDLVYCFDDELGDETVMGSGCVCTDISAKFFLYNSKNHDTVFTMHFGIEQGHDRNLFGGPVINEPHVYIFHIKTNVKYRKMGIASYYINKVVEFTESCGMNIVALEVAPSTSDTKNVIGDKNELQVFYERFSNETVKVICV